MSVENGALMAGGICQDIWLLLWCWQMLAGVMPWAADSFLIEVLAEGIMKGQMLGLKRREKQRAAIKNWLSLWHIGDLGLLKLNLKQ